MSERDEQIFQSSNKCWICDKLFDAVDNNVRDHLEVLLIEVVIFIFCWLKKFL